MKILLCASLLVLGSALTQAQTDTARPGTGLLFKIDVLWPLAGHFANEQRTYSISIEKELMHKESIQLTYYHLYQSTITAESPSVYPYSTAPSSSSYIYTNTYRFSGLILEGKYYFSKKNNHMGWYGGICIDFVNQYRLLDNTFPPSQPLHQLFNDYSIALGVVGGYQMYVSKKIEFDFLAGIVNKVVYFPPAVSNVGLDSSLLGLINFNLGYRF